MVSIADRLPRGLRQTAGVIAAALSPPDPPSPGLYTFRVVDATGRAMRVHLRIAADGSGVLFRDVTDVVHLNATATEMAKLALDGVAMAEAAAVMRARYRGVGKEQLAEELGRIFALVEAMRDSDDACPTCAVPELPRAALFSTPIQAPYKADLALTYGCNNACAHCYNEPGRYAMPSLPKEGWFRVIDVLHRVGVPHLILTGGEATLVPDLVEIIHYADGLGHVVGLNTNGRRLAHPPFVEALAAAGLNHVQITLGSCQPEVHDRMMGARAFGQTVRGIENAVASPIHAITNTTLVRSNMDHAEDIVDFLFQLGIRTFAMNGMIHAGGGFANPEAIAEEAMPALLARVRDRAASLGMRFLWYTPTEYCRLSPVALELGVKRCNAGEYSLCVEPNGDVLPCQSYYLPAGNLLRDPWEGIWHSPLFEFFRGRVADPQGAGLPEKCWACPDLAWCGGGCPLERLARVGYHGARPGEQAAAGCSGCSVGPQRRPQEHGVPVLAPGFVPGPPLASASVRGSGAVAMPWQENM